MSPAICSCTPLLELHYLTLLIALTVASDIKRGTPVTLKGHDEHEVFLTSAIATN